MVARPLTRREITELGNRLRGLIAVVDEGEMTATTAMTYRLQGAVTALDAVSGSSLTDITENGDTC